MSAHMSARISARVSTLVYTHVWPTDPAAVVRVHQQFIANGARVITTCSYACTHNFLSQGNIAHRQEELLAISGEP